MKPIDRFERQIPWLLTELAEPRTPDYLDDLLWQTANTSQRPAWSILERWLPMVDIARQPVIAPRIPLRMVGLGLLVITLLLAAVAALMIGTQPNLPPPFGPARNGLIAYSSGGDIYSVDPLTGAEVALVSGPETDLEPRWLRDGARFAFLRKAQGDSGPSRLVVARADGSALTVVTPDALAISGSFEFSPDGREIVLPVSDKGVPRIMVAATDGSGIRELNVGMPASGPSWRPPDGAEILFSNGEIGLYAVDVESGVVRTIVGPSAGLSRGLQRWSPDGSRIAYSEWGDSSDWTVRIHIIAAEGGGARLLPKHPDAVWESVVGWSNDGTRLIAIRGDTGGPESGRAVVIPVDEGGFGLEVESPAFIASGDCSWEWAPDDSSILGASGNGLPLMVLDPVAGTSQSASWTTTSCPTWQRLAP